MVRKKEVLTRTCGQCIHEWACSMQCGGNPMAQGNAMHCACYEDVKSSTAYFIGMLDGRKENIPDRMVELMCADQEGRVIVLPCKVGQRVFALLDTDKHISECEVKQICMGNEIGFFGLEPIGARGREYGVALNGFGKTVFLTRKEAEREMEEKRNG